MMPCLDDVPSYAPGSLPAAIEGPPVPFVERSGDARMFARRVLELAGADGFGYTRGGLQVCVAVGRACEVDAAARLLDLELVESCQFPLGTDRPPERFRHVSWSYGGEPSCWHFRRYRPVRLAD